MWGFCILSNMRCRFTRNISETLGVTVKILQHFSGHFRANQLIAHLYIRRVLGFAHLHTLSLWPYLHLALTYILIIKILYPDAEIRLTRSVTMMQRYGHSHVKTCVMFSCVLCLSPSFHLITMINNFHAWPVTAGLLLTGPHSQQVTTHPLN